MSTQPEPDPRGAVARTKLSRTQRVVAQRMVDSRASVPEFALTVTVAMDAAMEWLREAKAQAGERPAPSVNDLVIRASALALREQPLANGAYADGVVESFERVNVGFAVAAPGTLLVPTLFDADALSIWETAAQTRELARRARERELTPAEMTGATFTVSNLGMLGIEHFTAVINSPQAAILSVGAVRAAAVVRDDALAIGRVATLTLNCDHRVLYGADGAELLAGIRRRLEAPAELAGAA
ncbi:MAG TPA: 2-oxo acid dehydrogenase subunit E2 [Conexibacter sp.]|nr:2-oxo acid dehydrogenase subunit E2 [Conexibacter sp.]